MMESFKIKRIKSGITEAIDDLLAREVPLTISIGNEEFATLLCSPNELKDLVIGFLFASSLIRCATDIENISINEEKWTADVN